MTMYGFLMAAGLTMLAIAFVAAGVTAIQTDKRSNFEPDVLVTLGFHPATGNIASAVAWAAAWVCVALAGGLMVVAAAIIR